MPRPLRVFLCHASQDKPAVWRLHRYLKQRGAQPWLDQADLLPGEDWEVEIPNAIYSSDVILVCLSQNSVDKEGYVQKEISFALDKALEKPGKIFIIPVKLEECEIPRHLSRYQWVDITRVDGRKRLLLGLNKRVSELGGEVTPVILEDTRKPKPITKPMSVEKQDGVDIAAHEKAEREALERAEREKTDRERVERETLKTAALEKAEQEKQARETAERLAREQKEREAAQKAALEKENREKAERETAERLAQEKAAFEKEKKEKQEREQVQPPVGRVSNPTNTLNENVGRAAYPFGALSPTYEDAPAPVVEKKQIYAAMPAPELDLLPLGIGAIVFAFLFLAVFGGNYLFNQIDFPDTTPSAFASATEFFNVDLTEPSTPAPTKTFTLVPPTFTPTPGIGSTKDGADGMTLVFVPAGEFTMGSDNSDPSDERPEHPVDLEAFWIDQTEVTNAMYQQCVDSTTGKKCNPPGDTNRFYDLNYKNHPVVNVSWNDANAYCSWADRRLPTEAEWEKAARGDDKRTYPWGEDISCDKANYYGCIQDTTPVGSYPDGASFYGAMDMAGNVWEWVSSFYQPYPYDANDGRESLTTSGSRVLRGGAWNNDDGDVRSAYRGRNGPAVTSYDIGFRCSLSP